MVWKIIGARGKFESVDQLLDTLKDLEKTHDNTIQIFRADRIFGELHLKVAIEHTSRAFEQGRNRSKHMGTEILIHSAAERQIKNAIDKLGIKRETEKFALVMSGDVNAEELVKELGLIRDDSVLEGEKDHTAFGVGDADVAFVGRERIIDLILEKMALIELER